MRDLYHATLFKKYQFDSLLLPNKKRKRIIIKTSGTSLNILMIHVLIKSKKLQKCYDLLESGINAIFTSQFDIKANP